MEKRLLYLNLPENEPGHTDAFNAFEAQTRPQNELLNARLEDRLSTKEIEALQTLDAAKEAKLYSWRGWIGADTRYATAANDIAKTYLKEANERLSKAENSAVRKIASRANRTNGSFHMLRYEVESLENTLNALKVRRSFLMEKSRVYAAVAKEMGFEGLGLTGQGEAGVKETSRKRGRGIKSPKLESVENQIAVIEQQIKERKAKLNDSPAQEAHDRVATADGHLRRLIMQLDRNAAVNLNDMIQAAAAGNPRKLKSYINGLSLTDDTRSRLNKMFFGGDNSAQRKTLLKLAEEITGGPVPPATFGQEKLKKMRNQRSAVASYYANQASDITELTVSSDLASRVQAITRLPVGSRVVLDREAYGVTLHGNDLKRRRDQTKNKNRVYLTRLSDGTDAVLDAKRLCVTIRTDPVGNGAENDTLTTYTLREPKEGFDLPNNPTHLSIGLAA